MKVYEFIVKNSEDNFLISKFLKARNFSTAIIKKVKFGGVFLNDKCVNMRAIVHFNDKITVKLPPEEVNEYVVPKPYPIEVLYEDEYLIAVNKPSGMLTHNSKGNSVVSLDQVLANYFKPEPFVFRAVNRLDRDTSGIVIVAKDWLSSSLMGEQMKQGGFLKTYSAVVVGKMKNQSGVIDKPIKRENEILMKRIISSDGKRAISKYEVKKYYAEKDLSLVDVVLLTGRTHQIRVHFSSEGNPLYADSLYGVEVKGKTMLLHAKKIEFTHPITSKKLIIQKEPSFNLESL